MQVSKWAVAVLVVAAGSAAAFIGSGALYGGANGEASALSSGAVERDSAVSRTASLNVEATGAGIITTLAGNGAAASTGDDSAATQAALRAPTLVAADGAGAVYVYDTGRVRRIADGVIRNFAGTGTFVFTPRGTIPRGDGGPATAALFGSIDGLASDSAGNVYIADARDHRIRKVGVDGVIRTIAGIGEAEDLSWNIVPFAGEGASALSARLSLPTGLTVDAAGVVYFIDGGYIRRINTNGVITTIAGNGAEGSGGDGGPATQASVTGASHLATDPAGNLYVLDSHAATVRRISKDGIITRVAGGGPYIQDPVSLNMQFSHVTGLAVDGQGTIYVSGGNLVRRTSAAGVLDIIVGDASAGWLQGMDGFEGDGGPATAALLNDPRGLALDAAGNLYIADCENNRIRKVTPSAAANVPGAMDAFHPGEVFDLGVTPNRLAIADVTGDRRDDLVVVAPSSSDSSSVLQIRAQTPEGGLANPVASGVDTGVSALETADLNRDGRQDLVVATTAGDIRVALGTATGELVFQTLPRRWRNSQPGSPKVLDANRDDRLDIVVSESTATMGLSVYPGDGKGGFGVPVKQGSTLDTPHKLWAGDMNGDGNTDLLAREFQYSNASLKTLTSQTGNQFNQFSLLTPSGWLNDFGILGDWNGDARLDFAYTGHGLTLHYQAPAGLGPPVWDTSPHDPYRMLTSDIDGDGLDDILAALPFRQGLGVHLQRNARLEPDVKFPFPASFTSPILGYPDLAAGDLDSDGCRDVVMSEGSTTVVIYYAKRCRPPQLARDLDGDRRADIVWRNATTGANDLWRSADARTRTPMATVADGRWAIAGIGDFDGDGRSDLFWRHQASGANDIWPSGKAHLRLAAGAEPDPAWKVAAVGDFDNDGREDLFWRNAATGQNGVWWAANRATSQAALAWPDANWEIVGVGDFSGDAKDDLLWRNAATGSNELWPSASHARRRALPAVTSLSWKIVAVADFNGDGNAEILWRHAQTGANVIWVVGRSTTQRAVATVSDVNWQVAGTADYDGDGKADILWRHKLTGGNELWSEGNVKFRKVLAPVANTAWSVVPARP